MREPIVRVENVTVSFDGFKALQGMNFSMDPGELRVVIGPNGAGKTTLLDVITGKVKPVEGRVLFKGSEINGLRVNQIANLGIGRKFQTPWGVYELHCLREPGALISDEPEGFFDALQPLRPRSQHATVRRNEAR